jgi:hypothetical protein
MKELAVHIKDFLTTQTWPQAAASTAPSSHDGPLGRAIVLLSEHRGKTLSLDDYLEIADYFGRDKAQAVIFCNLPEPTVRVAWLEKTLRKLRVQCSSNAMADAPSQ